MCRSLFPRFLFQVCKRDQRLIGVHVGHTLLISSYVVPGDEQPMKQAQLVAQQIETHNWQGSWLWLGDWNEPIADSWIHSLAVNFGGRAVEEQDHAARWHGHAVIDFMLTNLPRAPSRTRYAWVSDHKSVEASFIFPAKVNGRLGFRPHANFAAPAWLSKPDWSHLLGSSAVNLSQITEESICNTVVNEMDWDTPDDEQLSIDFRWAIFDAWLVAVFQDAFALSLFYIPESFCDWEEIHRVERVINRKCLKGTEMSVQA